MENIIKQLKNGAKDTRLSYVEKAAIKSQLLHYVKNHPAGDTSHSYVRGTPSPFSIQNFRNKKTLTAFVIGGILMGSTVSLAAENTVPGDVLYPVKIHINEPVLGVIAVTPQAKADWNILRAERRLVEVEKLATVPSASPEIKASAKANFQADTNRVQARIADFEDTDDHEDAVRTAGRLTNMLRKHEKVLSESSLNKEASSKDGVAENSLMATTTTSTSSSFAPVRKKKDSPTEDVLDNVRDARGRAEKAQERLKNKYHIDDMEENEVRERGVLNVKNSNKNENREEIRNSVSGVRSKQIED